MAKDRKFALASCVICFIIKTDSNKLTDTFLSAALNLSQAAETETDQRKVGLAQSSRGLS